MNYSKKIKTLLNSKSFRVFRFVVLIFSPMTATYGVSYLWKILLRKHGVDASDYEFASILSATFFFFFFGLLFILSSKYLLRKIGTALVFLYALLFLSEYTYFFHYGSYIKFSFITQILHNPGEVVWLISEGTGPEQIFFFLKSFFILLLAFFPVVFFTYDLHFKNEKSYIFHKSANLRNFSILFLIIGLPFFFRVQLPKEKSLQAAAKSVGTLETHLFFQITDLFREKEQEQDVMSDLNVPERFIDPREISFDSPNIVLIIMDSVRHDHLPHYGYERITTPFLNSKSKELLKVDVCYTQANGTSLALPSLLMGKYPAIQTTVPKWNLFSYLKKEGYKSAVFSSMDLRWGSGWQKQVLDYFKDDGVEKVFHAAEVPEEYRHLGFSKTIYNYGVDDGFTAAAANKWLETAKAPFFLIIHFHSTHYSYEVPEKYVKFKPVPKLPFRSAPPWTPMLNAYDNAIYRVDDAIAEVFWKMESKKFLDNAIVAITADHGESFDEHPGSYYHMTSVYETQVRVPLLFYFGRKNTKAKILVEEGKNRITGLVDVMPTLFKSSGIPLSNEFEGAPIWGTSSKSYEKMISYHFRPKYAARAGKWKYIQEMDIHKTHLYDLSQDPGEKNNLAAKFPEIISAFDISQGKENRVGKYSKKKQ